jgi:(2Fe-2S) ferredoxin
MDDYGMSIFSNRRGRRILICVRGRCAPPELGRALEKRLLHLIQQHGLDAPEHPQYVTCRTVQCLNVCQDGPIMIIHPEAVRYRLVDEAALERIFQQHLLGGEPVTDLLLPPHVSSASN